MQLGNSQPEDRWQTITDIWKKTPWLSIVAGFLIGLMVFPIAQAVFRNFSDFLTNLVPEVIGILVAVLIIDRIYRQRADQERFEELTVQMRSRDNGIALQATDLLATKKWLSDGRLVNRNFSGARLTGAFLAGANLARASFSYAELDSANLEESNLSYANLRQAKFDYAVMSKANVSASLLIMASMQHSIMFQANLSKCDLFGANLSNAILDNSNLKYANLWNANLDGARLELVDLQGAKFNERTKLPDGSYYRDIVDLRRFTDRSHPDFWGSDQ